MMCFNPVKVYLSDETRKKRQTFRDMPQEWRFATHIFVPCGKCPACLSKRRQMWSFRLQQEVKHCETCYFITLTYDDEHLSFKRVDDCLVPVVSKRDVQLFLKRLRKSIEPYKIRYFVVSEYGPKTYRPHYHMILFNFPLLLKNKLDDYLRDAWGNGFIRVDPVTDGRVNYVTSYCLDSSTLPPYLDKNFMLCSRRPGIGAAYLDDPDIVDYHVRNLDAFGYVPTSGEVIKTKLPRYYVDKILCDFQRNAISLASAQFYAEKHGQFVRRQRKWLLKHGYDVTPDNLKTAFPGSPMDLELQQRDEFARRVEQKCKMKKDF